MQGDVEKPGPDANIEAGQAPPTFGLVREQQLDPASN